ncbi:protein MAIN-LIKE 2-like [Hibiscus syriacus]|uniref:protein MAIN-LIKE 2-like n=1 Tax=Hibiscus syriacus TaxID=106335 RepID=UPI00192336B7|nr:protein MAIN-LIKE 2-like [Hibiscus syriacus]
MSFINRFPSPNDDIIPYLHEAGLGYIGTVTSGIKLHPPLINALIERWRLEMHIFHFPCVKPIITLEDVAYHLGLSIGNPITGMVHENWGTLCEELLRVTPMEEDLDGGKIYIKFLGDNFVQLPIDVAPKIK